MQKVNKTLNELVLTLQDDDEKVLKAAGMRLKSYVDTCSKLGDGAREEGGLEDSVFEKLLLSCASDDQKKIRKKLNEMYEQVQALGNK